MKTAVIYARYSSDRQTEQSIEGQVRVCMEYAERNDIVIVGTYIDRAMTGTNDNREQFQKMLKDSDKKSFGYVLVYKLDRFSRNKYEMAIHRKHLKDNGVKILSAMENIPDSPEGILLESLLEGMNKYYSEELSQKTKRGLRETRIKGNFIGGPVNYGYSVKHATDSNGNPSGSKLVVNENEAQILRQIFSDYANGRRLLDIIRELNDKGIKNRGKPFKENAVYVMLQQEKYTGVYRIHGETYDNIYPPIIPAEIFQVVKKRIDANKYGKHVTGVDYLLKGKMFCGYCGRAYSSATGTSKDGTIYRYYKCPHVKSKTGCLSKPVKKEPLEKIISDTMIEQITLPGNIKILINAISAKFNDDTESNSKLRLYERELTATNKSLNNIIAAIENGIYTQTTKQRLEKLEHKKIKLEESILIEKANIKRSPSEKEIEQFIINALKLKPKPFIDTLIKRIEVFNNRIEILLKYTGENPPDKHKAARDRNDDPCRGRLLFSFRQKYDSCHTRTYKSKKTREFHRIREIKVNVYI